MRAPVRRWGLTGLAAALGVLLLVSGVAVAVVDAQIRSDAATAAVTLTPGERRQLEEADLAETVVADAGFIRRLLIVRSLSTGITIPERAFVIHEQEDGILSVEWGAGEGFLLTSPWGGWPLTPISILTFAGLALTIGSLFLAAAHWHARHPVA